MVNSFSNKAENDSLSLSLDGGWAIGEEAFNHIVDVLDTINPKRILEYGSGPSSIRLAQAFPDTQIVSVEGSREYYEEAQSLRQKWSVEERLKILLLPIEYDWYGLSRIQSYRSYDHTGSFDAVIVDGPPHWTLRGREACLYQTYEHIPEGGVVILDDYSRADEQAILQNWLATYPGSFQIEVVSVDEHLAILRKVRHVRPRWFALPRMIDNIIANVQRIRPYVSASIPKPIRAIIKNVVSLIKKNTFAESHQ